MDQGCCANATQSHAERNKTRSGRRHCAASAGSAFSRASAQLRHLRIISRGRRRRSSNEANFPHLIPLIHPRRRCSRRHPSDTLCPPRVLPGSSLAFSAPRRYIFRRAALATLPHGAKFPELLNHAASRLPTKTPTADALQKMTATKAWAACVILIRRVELRGGSGNHMAPEWPGAEHIRVLGRGEGDAGASACQTVLPSRDCRTERHASATAISMGRDKQRELIGTKQRKGQGGGGGVVYSGERQERGSGSRRPCLLRWR